MSLKSGYTIVGINYWPEPTGNAPYNTDLAEELAKFSDVTVIAGVPHYPWWKRQNAHDDLGYSASHPGLRLVRRNHFVPRGKSNLLRAVMEITFGFNVILSGKLKGPKIILVSPAMLSSAIAMFWLKLTNPTSKTLVWVQDLYEQGLLEIKQASRISSTIISAIEDWLLRTADQVVVAHPAFLAAKKIEQGRADKFLAIPNWTQFAFSPTEKANITRERYEVGEAKLVLHIGNMGVKQGLENVIEAARLAHEGKAEIQFMFVGGGNQLERLENASMGLSNVRFLPPVSESELSNLLQAADVLLVNEMLGVKEMSFPSKLTTYLIAGRPVLVCSDKESLAGRTVAENGIGHWVQSGRPIELLKKIESLDLEGSIDMVSNAREFARDNLSKESSLSKFLETLQKL